MEMSINRWPRDYAPMSFIFFEHVTLRYSAPAAIVR